MSQLMGEDKDTQQNQKRNNCDYSTHLFLFSKRTINPIPSQFFAAMTHCMQYDESPVFIVANIGKI
jgi:hypothetical protein